MLKFYRHFLLAALTILPAAAQVTFDFSTPVTLGASQAPGVWYPDRKAPNGFVSPVVAPNGTPNTLQESIAATDAINGQDAFANTQGRKFDIPPTSNSVTIALYVPCSWATENARKAAVWITPTPPSGSGDFPIIEYQGAITSDPAISPGFHPNGGVAGFYGFNNVTGNYDLITTSFTCDAFVQLTITFTGTDFIYAVGNPFAGGASIHSPEGTPGVDTGFSNVILQGYNYGADYSIFWDGVASQVLDSSVYQVRYASNLNIGDSVVNVVNTGASVVAGGSGNICVNVYVFDPAEELLSCCSCPVTPDGLASFSVRNQLISNNLTSEIPTSVVIELVSTLANGCTNSAAMVTSASGTNGITAGLAAWGTTIHALPATPPAYGVTETPFTPSPLSLAEINRLDAICGFIQSNGSGFGICKGCSAGGLGAVAVQ